MAFWTSASLTDAAHVAHPQSRPGLKKRSTAPRLPRKQPTSKHQGWKRSRDLHQEAFSPEASEEEEDTMSSFPPFCASCDKQLPDLTSLYCSDKCRKHDLQGSPTYTPQTSQWRPSTANSRGNASIASVENIVPQMVPSPPPVIMSATQAQGTRPSEGQGRPGGRRRRTRPVVDRSDSEAARYLAQFHSSDRSSDRPRASRNASSSEDALPGLSSTSSSFTSSSTPPTPCTSLPHPPARKNRWSSAFSSQSVELVTPTSEYPQALSPSLMTVTAATEGGPCMPRVSATTASDGMPFEKRKPVSSSEVSSGRGSLKQLFTSGESRPALAEEA